MGFKVKVMLLVLAVVFTAGFLTATTAPEGGTYIMSIHEDLTTTNYINYLGGPGSTVWNSYVLGNMHKALYALADVTFAPVPDLAGDWATPVTKTGDLWTSDVCIRDGVQFSNGEVVTTSDVAFSYNAPRGLDPDTLELKVEDFPILMGQNWPSLIDPEFLDHVEVLDSECVRFYLLKKPGLARWEYGLLQAPLLSEDYWKDKFLQAFDSADPVVTLMSFPATDEPSSYRFTFGQWQPGAFAQISANEFYYNQGATVEEYANGAYREYKEGVYDDCWFADCTGDRTLEFEVGPHVDSVVYTYYGTMSAAALALIGGEVMFQLNPLSYELGLRRQLEAAPNVEVIQNASNGMYYLSFNLRKEPFSKLGYREALDCVIDREFVCNDLLQGVAVPAYAPVPPGNAYWYRVPTPEEQDARCVGLCTGEKVARAVEYLRADGFSWEQEPVVDGCDVIQAGKGIMLDGVPVAEIELIHPNAAYDNKRNIFGLHIEERANMLGIPVRSVPTGFNVIVARVFVEQDFDMWQLGWSLGIYPDHLESFFHSRNTVPGGSNSQGYSNPEFDALADELLAAQDLTRALEVVYQLQEFLAAELPYVLTHYAPVYEAYRSDMIAFPYTEVLDGLSNLNGLPGLVKLAR